MNEVAPCVAVWHAWNGIIKSIHLVNNYKKHLMCSVVEIEKRFLFTQLIASNCHWSLWCRCCPEAQLFNVPEWLPCVTATPAFWVNESRLFAIHFQSHHRIIAHPLCTICHSIYRNRFLDNNQWWSNLDFFGFLCNYIFIIYNYNNRCLRIRMARFVYYPETTNNRSITIDQ